MLIGMIPASFLQMMITLYAGAPGSDKDSINFRELRLPAENNNRKLLRTCFDAIIFLGKNIYYSSIFLERPMTKMLSML
jgi:hypothetical protein